MPLRENAEAILDTLRSDRPLIYISGPITKGCRNHNLYQAMVAHETLIRHGFSVINPMPSMMYPFNSIFQHNEWLENDLPHVAASEAVLRLEGESLGAEMECIYAERCGVPVYTSIEELIDAYSHRPSVADAARRRSQVT